MPVRVYILTHDEQIFHPRFFETVLSTKPGEFEVIGAGIVKRTKKETTRASLEHLYRMGGLASTFRVAAILAGKKIRAATGREPGSVRAPFAAHQVPVRDLDSPNQPDFVAWLGTQNVDIVTCSITNMLKTPLLRTPRLACVNRHSGRLPDYRGFEPVFQALRRREPTVTVTFHIMVEELDGGKVLWERPEPVTLDDTVFSLYDRLYRLAAGGYWQALSALPGNGIRDVDLTQGAVYKRPTDEQIAEFRATGRRYV